MLSATSSWKEYPYCSRPPNAPGIEMARRLSVRDTVRVSTESEHQMGSMTPEAGGAKPAEAVMSSIEPVNLPESAVWESRLKPVDPVYAECSESVTGRRAAWVCRCSSGGTARCRMQSSCTRRPADEHLQNHAALLPAGFCCIWVDRINGLSQSAPHRRLRAD